MYVSNNDICGFRGEQRRCSLEDNEHQRANDTTRLLTLENTEVLRASNDEKELSKVTSEPPKIFADISQDIRKEKSKCVPWIPEQQSALLDCQMRWQH